MYTRTTKHFWVTGRVQGVFYRASTEAKAGALGVTGWVRNLSDGRVEVIATGTESQLVELEKWLWQGPEKAMVESVEIRDEPLTEFEGFRTRF